MSSIIKIISKFFGNKYDKDVKSIMPIIESIHVETEKLKTISNDQLRNKTVIFKEMIYSESYQMLIEHEKNEITILSENKNVSVFKVYILSANKKKYSYMWQIEKVQTEGNLKNCWMTTSVSAPEFLGEVI